MASGVVKQFDRNKGYGFITPDDGEADVYVHFSQVRGGNLKEGDRVEFELGQGIRPQATAVKREGEEDPPEEEEGKEKPSFA